jgi:hypothetical protein
MDSERSTGHKSLARVLISKIDWLRIFGKMPAESYPGKIEKFSKVHPLTFSSLFFCLLSAERAMTRLSVLHDVP